jgi:hypothetical protein
MTTSGTTGFNLDLAELIDEAYERAGKQGALSGYDFKTARRSLNILLSEFANQGINLWTISEGSIPLVTGVDAYDLPTDTVDLLEAVIRTNSMSANQVDITLPRISVSTYATIPNKNVQGRPLQMWIERLSAPRLRVWPVPNNDSYELVYWRLRRLQDAGGGVNTQDVPFRFLAALTAGLAYHLAMKVTGGMERLQMLKAQYDEALTLAQLEDRDKSPVRLVPRIGR